MSLCSSHVVVTQGLGCLVGIQLPRPCSESRAPSLLVSWHRTATKLARDHEGAVALLACFSSDSIRRVSCSSTSVT
jgi:hypothetical protein